MGGVFSTKIKAGDKFPTRQGCTVEVIKYEACNKITVKFIDYAGHEKITATQELLTGRVKNPFHPQVRGIGFFGVGPYKAKEGIDTTPEYVHWSSMLTRSYYEGYHQRFPTYVGCSVDEQWHNFQEFAEWCQWQPGHNMGHVLDKDVLVQGNKVYGPETCVFVPPELNSIIVTQVKPGKGTPAGISFQTSAQKYIVSCAINGKNKNLGRYKCATEAFAVYKEFKECLVKERAEKYKDVLDERAYQAFINYTVPETIL